MKKIIIGAVLVLFITVGFGVYYILSNLDMLVKEAIETYGSQVTQTAVRVENVQIGLRDGSAAIFGLSVGSPEGFAAQQAFSLGEIAAQIDLDSLSGEVMVIDTVTVKAPEVFFELNASGKNNLEELKRNMTSGQSASSSSSPNKQSSTKEIKLIIRKFLFTDGSIAANVVPMNKKYELKLPAIELKNLGGKNGGTPDQIADQVLKVLADRAMDEVKKQGLDQYQKRLEGEVNKRLDAEQQKLNDKVGDKLKGVLNY